jgi:DNA gyrase subunit A
VEGLLRAMGCMEELLQVIKTSADTTMTKQIFSSEPYNFTEAQTDAILGLTLRRLTSLEHQKLVDELTVLRTNIATYQEIMTMDAAVHEIIIQESQAIMEKYGTARKTIISTRDSKLIEPHELTENERYFFLFPLFLIRFYRFYFGSSLITITKNGYIKRIPMKEIEAQSRGGKGKSKAKFAVEEDTILHSFVCLDHDGILLFTNQ